MSATNAVVAIYDSHSQAEEAVKELQKAGVDMKKLSIVGKDYHTDEQVWVLQYRRPHEVLGKTGLGRGMRSRPPPAGVRPRSDGIQVFSSFSRLYSLPAT